jgi:DNA repair protein RadC
MKRLAPADRPREKLARAGASALGDNELVAVILGQGGAGRTALDLGTAVLACAGGPTGLSRVTLVDLQRVDGVGVARAAQILAAVELGRRTLAASLERQQFTKPHEVAAWLLPQFGGAPVEQFGAVLLDTKHRLLSVRVVSIGSLDASAATPRDVFREAVAARAAAVIVFHNHPSGDPVPSPDDVAVTEQLVAAGAILGIDVIDHVILGGATYFSFREARSSALD